MVLLLCSQGAQSRKIKSALHEQEITYRVKSIFGIRKVKVLQLFTQRQPYTLIFVQKRMQVSTDWLPTETERQNSLFFSVRFTRSLSSAYPRISGLWFSISAHGRCQKCFQHSTPPILHGFCRRIQYSDLHKHLNVLAALYVFHIRLSQFLRYYNKNPVKPNKTHILYRR